ncbi:hypothetical protein ABIC83_002989 [Roseateles asaccharophilus]|uniref:hypothetical protein n=1 Tax=Roseateles asaccharophilus TaxID=582607 RepID=UPI00383421AE
MKTILIAAVLSCAAAGAFAQAADVASIEYVVRIAPKAGPVQALVSKGGFEVQPVSQTVMMLTFAGEAGTYRAMKLYDYVDKCSPRGGGQYAITSKTASTGLELMATPVELKEDTVTTVFKLSASQLIGVKSAVSGECKIEIPETASAVVDTSFVSRSGEKREFPISMAGVEYIVSVTARKL